MTQLRNTRAVNKRRKIIGLQRRVRNKKTGKIFVIFDIGLLRVQVTCIRRLMVKSDYFIQLKVIWTAEMNQS